MPALFAALLAISYAAAFTRARRRRHRPSISRFLAFMTGCVLIVASTASGVEALAQDLLSAFMFQQLTLMMIAAPLLVLGSPGTVILRGVPHRGVGLVLLRLAIYGLRSRIAAVLLHPLAVTPLTLLALFGLYLTGSADAFLASDFGRAALQLAFLTIGVLVAAPLISSDPLPRRTSYLARVVDAFVEMQIHAAFGLTLIFSGAPLVNAFARPPAEYGIDPLADQQLAGALVWTYGELPVLVILIVSLVRWQRQDSRRAARNDRRADADGDADLEQYNRYLQTLRRPEH